MDVDWLAVWIGRVIILGGGVILFIYICILFYIVLKQLWLLGFKRVKHQPHIHVQASGGSFVRKKDGP